MRELNGYRYCPCDDDTPAVCPACGAGAPTGSGVCQLPAAPEEPYLQIVLINKATGEIV